MMKRDVMGSVMGAPHRYDEQRKEKEKDWNSPRFEQFPVHVAAGRSLSLVFPPKSIYSGLYIEHRFQWEV